MQVEYLTNSKIIWREQKHLPVSDVVVLSTARPVSSTRSQLLESGKLLAEAEHSFETVTAGFGDATGTIAGLSARLDQKSKGLLKAERELRTSRAEASRLKKVGRTQQARCWGACPFRRTPPLVVIVAYASAVLEISQAFLNPDQSFCVATQSLGEAF